MLRVQKRTKWVDNASVQEVSSANLSTLIKNIESGTFCGTFDVVLLAPNRRNFTAKKMESHILIKDLEDRPGGSYNGKNVDM